MVESNIFDESPPPLVHATPLSLDNTTMTMASRATSLSSSDGAPPSVVEPLQLDGSTVVVSGEIAQQHQRRVMVGAGVAAGFLGLFLGGPVLACIVGFGTAYATKQDGATGDVARAVGHVALTAQEKAKEVNTKHHLVERTHEAAKRVVERATEMEHQHNILQRTKTFLDYSWTQLVETNREHRVLERTMNAMSTALSSMAQAFSNAATNAQQHSPNNTITTQQQPSAAPQPSAPMEPLPTPIPPPRHRVVTE